MSLALYRKYRPGTFAEVRGQEHVTEPLMQALRNGRVAHAYLFSGPRGCGKTSSARILARSLNCDQGPTPTPCGVCDSCVALAPNGPGSLDVVEIDAASHGGVDDARDLRERAFYAPVSSRYKVYIVDEAHMVTTAGFNALLKLVEEPPEFLKFVFATTEPEKVIGTIRSRTHHYPFRLVPPGVLREHLIGVCAMEGVEVDPAVLPLVVRAGAGSVRDALSVLDQLLGAAGPQGVTYAGAVALLGYTDAALLDEVVDAFAARDGAAVFETVEHVVEAGHDPRRFTADLLERFRDLLILSAVPDAAAKRLVDEPADRLDRMVAQAGHLGPAELSRSADVLHEGLVEMRGTTSPRLLLELVCARVLLPGAAADLRSVLARLDRLERRLELSAPGARPMEAPSAPGAVERATERATERAVEPAAEDRHPSHPEVAPVPDPVEEPPPAVSPVEEVAGAALDAAAVRRVWPDVLDAVKARKRTTHAQLLTAQVVKVTGRVVTIAFTHAPIARSFSQGVSVEVLCDALKEVFGVEWEVVAVIAGDGDAVLDTTDRPDESPAPGRPTAGRRAPAPAAQHDGFASGDGPADDEPDAGGPRRSAEDTAMDLLRSGLGAKVIGQVEST